MATDYNSQFVNDTIARANQEANAAYQRGMLELGNKQLAFQQAQQAWKETVDTSGLTGMFQGQLTMPTQQAFATMFGTWGTPQQGDQTQSMKAQLFGQDVTAAGLTGQFQGQQTQQAQQQAFQQGQDVAAMYGQSYGAGGPGAGTQTLAGQQQGFTQGLQTLQEQRAAQAQQQSQTQAYLQLLSSLRGPADWAKYQQVLGSTPGGMRDLYAAAMGQYVPGGGATTGQQPQAVSLQSMQGQIAGQPYSGQGGGQLGQPDVYGQNTAGMYTQQPPVAGGNWTPPQQNATANALQQSINPALGQQAQQQYQQAQQQYGQQQPTQQQNAWGNGTNAMGAQQPGQPQANQMNLPAPNQIAAQSWKNLAPSQREMMMGDYEAQGWHKPDVEALMNQALPKYAANAPGAGTWRLRQ